MNNNRLLLVLISIVSLCLLVLCYQTYREINQPRIAYIDAEKVFNEFQMTLELKSKLETTIKARNQILDSLQVPLKISDPQKTDKRIFSHLERVYFEKRDLFEQQNQELTEKYDRQVWLRIDQYLKSFGESDKYDFILSTNNNSAIVFAKNSFDITDQVIRFMNESYSNGLSFNEK